MMVDIANLPARINRSAAAALLTQHFFPVSPRTLERWPIATRRVNGRALIDTADLIAVAKAKLDAAPLIASGSAPAKAAA